MKKILIIETMVQLALVIIIVMFVFRFEKIDDQLKTLKPQLKEEMVSVQTVKLDGEIYVCGTVVENRDKDSLYCRGYTDGYSWAVAQDNIDRQLNQNRE